MIAPAPTPPTDARAASIRTLFPAVHHAHADRSAVGRARALWAATRRGTKLAAGRCRARGPGSAPAGRGPARPPWRS